MIGLTAILPYLALVGLALEAAPVSGVWCFGVLRGEVHLEGMDAKDACWMGCWCSLDGHATVLATAALDMHNSGRIERGAHAQPARAKQHQILKNLSPN